MQTGFLSRLPSLLAILSLAFAGALVLPVAGYVAGKRLIGAYEGKLGLSDYLGSIYSGAARGDILAWWLLLAPALIAIVWYLIIRLGWPPDSATDQE